MKGVSPSAMPVMPCTQFATTRMLARLAVYDASEIKSSHAKPSMIMRPPGVIGAYAGPPLTPEKNDIYIDETKGEVQVLYAAGANDMKTSKMHPYATTGIRRWNLTEMAQWALPVQ